MTDLARGVVLALATYVESTGSLTRRERQRIAATLRELLARAEVLTVEVETAEAERQALEAEKNLHAHLANAGMQRAEVARALAEAVRAKHAAFAKMEEADSDGLHWDHRDAFRAALADEVAALSAWDALNQTGEKG